MATTNETSRETIPSVSAEQRIARPSVDRLLDRAAERQICLVIGAAGSGKTTAVAAWSCNRPVVWLPFAHHGGDPRRLLSGVFGALQRHRPQLRSGGATAATSWDQATAIRGWLPSSPNQDLLLVLDDLHGLQPGSETAGIVEDLCQQAPDWLHLVLISRHELPFSLEPQRGRGLVAEIHAPDLVFDLADVEALLRKTIGRDPAGLPRRVWEHTDGWPAAVHCAVEMLRTVEADQRMVAIGQLCHPGQRFHDYVAEEVIRAAPEWVQRLLRTLAIFGEIKSPTEITDGLDDPSTGLAALSRQGLIRRTGGDHGWSLARPLRDYFAYQAAALVGERKVLHAAAARECLKRGALADALRHLISAGDHAACAALLVGHGRALVERGELDAVLQAEQLPAEHLNDPRIQQVLGQAQQVRGQWGLALRCFQRAGLDRDQLAPALAWRVGVISSARGDFAEVHELVGRALLDQEDTLDEIRVLTMSANAYRMTGDIVCVRKLAARAHAAALRCGDPRAWSGVHHLFAILAAVDCNWRQADALFVDALRNAETSGDLLGLMWIRASRAFYQFEMGASRRALDDAEIVLSLSARCEDPFLVAHVLTTRGRACGRLGMLEAAAGNFATAINLFQRVGSRFLAWPLCGLGDLYRTKGQLVRARAAYEEALAVAKPCHDIFGYSSALIGLARISAADDLKLAREYAHRAVELGEELRRVPAFLARGWVELMGGNRQGASADADRAAEIARQRRDGPGLAEAITLGVLASNCTAAATAPLREAVDIWQETGCRLDEATTRIVAARLGVPIAGIEADHARQILRDHGVDVESRRAAGPLGVLVSLEPAVSIRTLGAFRVIRDGVPVPNIAWKSKKARDLLKILIARRRPMPRDQLMELLWPEVNPVVAGNRLSVLLSAVRDMLVPHPNAESPLSTTDGAVSLCPDQVSVDVEDFLARAAAAFDAHRSNASNAIAQLRVAVHAHTGGFLEDDPYQEWASALTEEVRATHIALLRALITRLREAGDIDATVRYMLRLLEQDRYDEDANRCLVGVLLDGGRRGEARRHYENYVRRMTEIGVQPIPLSKIASRRLVAD